MVAVFYVSSIHRNTDMIHGLLKREYLSADLVI